MIKKCIIQQVFRLASVANRELLLNSYGQN